MNIDSSNGDMMLNNSTMAMTSCFTALINETDDDSSYGEKKRIITHSTERDQMIRNYTDKVE